MSNEEITVLPRFLGEEGDKFLTLRFGCTGVPKAHIVFIPPFVEEMNRCRSLVATQAREFARTGYTCTLLDFYGTGDSQGQLCDASLQVWKDNIRLTIDGLQNEADVPLILWGLRLGGLIALDYAATSPRPPQHIILWQPVNAAKVYITQVLRQRVASLMVNGLPPETTKEIRKKLEDGEQVEISGYTLAGGLIRDLENIELSAMGHLCPGNIYWLEHVTEEGKEIGVAARKAVDQLVEQGNRVEIRTFCDPPIWLIHERDFAPQLLSCTSGLLS
jgi:exosortase A-associated hydrolase 2